MYVSFANTLYVSLPDELFYCSFESPDLCEMNSLDGIFEWTRHRGKTPSLLTGPTAAVNGNFYMYCEATGREKFDTAT